MSFKAQFGGRCGECNEHFDPGAEVCYINDVLVLIHNPCTPAEFEEIGHKPQNVCRRCFTVHNGECL